MTTGTTSWPTLSRPSQTGSSSIRCILLLHQLRSRVAMYNYPLYHHCPTPLAPYSLRCHKVCLTVHHSVSEGKNSNLGLARLGSARASHHPHPHSPPVIFNQSSVDTDFFSAEFGFRVSQISAIGGAQILGWLIPVCKVWILDFSRVTLRLFLQVIPLYVRSWCASPHLGLTCKQILRVSRISAKDSTT